MKNTQPLAANAVHLLPSMLQVYQRLVRDEVLPYQWEVLHDRVPSAAKSHCIDNFRAAAGQCSDAFYGFVFQDSDLYKWLEAAAYALSTQPDPVLEARCDEACALIAAAQQQDGYINTYYTVKDPNGRFTNLQQGHELYCAGHFFEAAVAYFEATGKRAILDTACRFADCLYKTFGHLKGQSQGYPGHQEVEIGLLKLSKVTRRPSYADLARHFITQRGAQPSYFVEERAKPSYRAIWSDAVIASASYNQSHQPPYAQRVACGHAVRALYMYSAMAELAVQNPALATACDALYENITQRQMYITGGVGATVTGESFTGDWDLPNDSAYTETCASVALMMFAKRMATLHGEGRYYDTVERAFFNGVLSGIATSGKAFFYVNPLSVAPSSIAVNPGLAHVKPERQAWFDCACCPTNIARTIMHMGAYAFEQSEDGLVINMPIAADIQEGAHRWTLTSGYPYDGHLQLNATGPAHTVHFRLGAFVKPVEAYLDGVAFTLTAGEDGYCNIAIPEGQHTLEIVMDLPIRYIHTHPNVLPNAGMVAVQRGPIVYCAEEVDNGEHLTSCILPPVPLLTEAACDLFPGAVELKTPAQRLCYPQEGLYCDRPPTKNPTQLTLVPYHLWANRTVGEMRVFLARATD